MRIRASADTVLAAGISDSPQRVPHNERYRTASDERGRTRERTRDDVRTLKRDRSRSREHGRESAQEQTRDARPDEKPRARGRDDRQRNTSRDRRTDARTAYHGGANAISTAHYIHVAMARASSKRYAQRQLH